MTWNLFFRWFDLWVGAYIDVPNKTLYVCPIPMFGVKIQWADAPHTAEAVQQKWPQMRVVRLEGDVVEIRIGGARLPIRADQWDEAGDFLDRVRRLWDMRVVWADAGTPVDGDCAKRLLVENEELRKTVRDEARSDPKSRAAAWEQANNYMAMYQESQREIDRLKKAIEGIADTARNHDDAGIEYIAREALR